MGDMNGDGIVNVLDIVIMVNIVVFGEGLVSGGGGRGAISNDPQWSQLGLGKFRLETQPNMPIHNPQNDPTIVQHPPWAKSITFHDLHTRILKSYEKKL